MPTKKESRDKDSQDTEAKPSRRTARSSGVGEAKKPTVSRRSPRRAVEDSGGAVPVEERQPLTHEQIAVRAYYIAEQWKAEGRDGGDDEVWLEAERQMRSERGFGG